MQSPLILIQYYNLYSTTNYLDPKQQDDAHVKIVNQVVSDVHPNGFPAGGEKVFWAAGAAACSPPSC